MKSATIAEIFLSLQGEGTPLVFLKPQVFFRLQGCNLAESAFGTNGCVWCDTPLGKKEATSCRVERVPASGEFTRISNPVALEDALKEIIPLRRACINPSMFFPKKTPSEVSRALLSKLRFHVPQHSLNRLKEVIKSRIETLEPVGVSFTGGEPLHQFAFVREVVQKLSDNKCLLHLETNASIPDFAEESADLFNTCSADIKDRTAGASRDWKLLVKTELEFIQRFVNAGNTHIFSKLVITNDTNLKEVKWIAEQIAAIDVDLVIQPVTSVNKRVKAPTLAKLEKLENQILDVLGDHLWINVQTHKLSLDLL